MSSHTILAALLVSNVVLADIPYFRCETVLARPTTHEPLRFSLYQDPSEISRWIVSFPNDAGIIVTLKKNLDSNLINLKIKKKDPVRPPKGTGHIVFDIIVPRDFMLLQSFEGLVRVQRFQFTGRENILLEEYEQKLTAHLQVPPQFYNVQSTSDH